MLPKRIKKTTHHSSSETNFVLSIATQTDSNYYVGRNLFYIELRIPSALLRANYILQYEFHR